MKDKLAPAPMKNDLKYRFGSEAEHELWSVFFFLSIIDIYMANWLGSGGPNVAFIFRARVFLYRMLAAIIAHVMFMLGTP